MQKTLEGLLYQDIYNKRLLLHDWEVVKRRWAKTQAIFPKNSAILKAYKSLVHAKKIVPNPELEKSLLICKVRTLSGVAPFAVMMKPYFCPGKCTYCVLEPGMPKSYMSDEPAAARAKMFQFDPLQQVHARIQQMEATGHKPEKLQIIVIGGTFSAYPDDYKREFLQAIYEAANGYTTPAASRLPLLKKEGISNISSSLEEEQASDSPVRGGDINSIHQQNETATHRIVGMSIETRPDWVTDKEIRLLRDYGVTKVQLGVQALDNTINKLTMRGHDVDAVRVATQKLRDAGFKINYHFMPNLPGSNPKKDVAMCKEMFADPDFRPDTLKIYPTIVIAHTALWAQWKMGKYTSYDDETLAQVLVDCYQLVPRYCRVDRLVRDITRQWTASGTKKTNMRQIVEQLMQAQGIVPQDIRSREVRDVGVLTQKVQLKTKRYKASGAWEHFISFEDQDHLFGMIRLRLPLQPNPMAKLFPVLNHAALIRELQVFGLQVPITERENDLPRQAENLLSSQTQHQSLGKQLLAKAESMALKQGYKCLAIISGVGVREYYRKLGYRLVDTYMVKPLH